jgi:hypothetical protein
VLNLLGVYLGAESQFLPSAPDNIQGFWEYIPFIDVNEAILKRLGGTWIDPPAFPPGWFDATELADLRTQARRVIAEGFTGQPLWGWKDPRTCLTLPFWVPLLPPMHYVICLRGMADVAQSLHRRDGLSTEKSAHLWLRYVASTFAHTAGRPRLLLFYEDLMADWQGQVRRLAAFVGVPQGEDDTLVRRAIQAAVDQELHHHRTPLSDAVDDPALPFAAKAASLVLRVGTRLVDGEELDLEAALDVFVRGAMMADAQQLDLIESRNALEAELSTARGELAERETELAGARAEVAAVRAEVLAVRGELVGREAELTVAREGLAAKEVEISKLSSGLAWGIISAYRRGVEVALPSGSRIRRAYTATMLIPKAVLRGLRSLITHAAWHGRRVD